MSELRPASLVLPPDDRAARSDHAQQLSRAQLAIILEGIADGITVLNPAGQLIYGNDAAARLIGYPNAQALLAVPLEDILRQFETFDEAGHPLADEDLPGRLALHGIPGPPQVIRFRVRATGEEHWSLVTSQAVFNEAGTLELVVSIFREITDSQAGRIESAPVGASGHGVSHAARL